MSFKLANSTFGFSMHIASVFCLPQNQLYFLARISNPYDVPGDWVALPRRRSLLHLRS